MAELHATRFGAGRYGPELARESRARLRTDGRRSREPRLERVSRDSSQPCRKISHHGPADATFGVEPAELLEDQ